MPRPSLPPHLGSVFTVADARRAGVTPSRLRARDLEAPYRGLRVVRADGFRPRTSALSAGETAASELRARAIAFARTMPANQYFTHVTAAVLWGLPVPSSLLRDTFGRLRPLDVGVFSPLRHPRHAGVRGHQVRPGSARVIEHGLSGVRLTTAASTWAMLGAVIVDEYDLVAVGDAVVREQMFRDDPPPLATPDQLRAAAAAGRRVGIRALRRALPRVRVRSASRMETRCRLILVDAGMPEPELNFAVRDETGELVACVDLAYPELMIAIEYEGEQHLTDPAQWAKDIARYEALAAMGWFVVRVTKSDVFDGASALVRRVRQARRSRADV
ncbi:hypothetical protein [Microbacterium terregens]|uniref:Endonuclease domain-containing protein n=1 Tax=Microbacterium terregens TaxID=69363 RepID=A0ABV5SZ52_9MICO